ncbi:hypothetical protein ACIPF8_10825 [Collimonas sp. NPDC087041]|uniref:hypothetical protein n=1 Tax=Collimonas sp. NPDC087041 TaxID=3363960 RepID=UPI00381A092E
MNSERQNIPVKPPAKIVLHGKYLTVIEKFVSTVTLNSEAPILRWSPEFEALRDSITKLHSKFLSKQNALSIVIQECVGFYGEHLDRTGSLSEHGNADLKTALILRIKNYLESLPRAYALRISLPSFPGWGTATYDVCEGIRIVIGDVPRPATNRLADLAGAAWDTPPGSDGYLEISTIGYVESSANSPLPTSCISQAKQCAFILTTNGICNGENFSQAKAKATMSETLTQKLLFTSLPDGLARCFGKLIPDETTLQVRENAGLSLLTRTTRLAITNEEKSEAFQNKLQHLRDFFDAKNEPDFVSIAAAIEWYEDSLFADNQTFSYIAACIGLEALLGSNDHLDSMSKRLSDRYAFLLGKNRAERENMILSYGKVLNLRGRLVHSKAARLSDEDVDLLITAQNMLLSIIRHELTAMYTAKNLRKLSAFASNRD